LEHLEHAETIDVADSWFVFLIFIIAYALLMDMIERVCYVAVFVAPEKMDSIFVIAEEWNFLFTCD